MREIQCKKCFFFTPEWCPKKRDSLDPDLIRDCQFYRTKTNADRIRSMSDEELAEFLKNVHRNGNGGNSPMSGMLTASDCWTEWLKQNCE